MYLPLNREHSKKLAVVLIITSVLLMPDIVAPTPLMDVILNVPLSMLIADIGDMEFWQAMVLTWIISYLLLIAGLLIYPYNTKKLLVGRIKAGISFMMSHPLLVAAGIITILVVYITGNTFFENHYETLKAYALEVLAR